MPSPRLLISVNNSHYQVIFLQGVDDLNGHSEYLVTVDTFDLEPLQNGLGQTVTLTFIADDDHSRILNACLLSIEDKGVIGANPKQADGLKRRYQLNLGTRLSLLEQTEHSRVFVDTDLKDVLYAVLADAGYHGAQIEFSLAKPLPATPQIVQAMESNAAFFKRLLSHYGLYYRVTSTGADAGIMITDNNLSSPYLSRGLLEVHHASGFNSQLAESAVTDGNGRTNFVGFSHCQVKHQYQRGLSKAMSVGELPDQDELAEHNLAQPVSTTLAQAAQVGEDQTLATHRFAQVITLTGNVPDIFAGCSFSLNDQSALNASGDYLCISVKHSSQQPSDETSQDGLSQYHCQVVAIPRGTPFKLPYEAFAPLPMVFSASVESIQPAPTLTETGEYYAKVRFDETAQAPLSSTQPLKKLVSYACANQPHATGWHFPLAHDSQVLLGCVNNDPSQAYIIGFDMNQAQPAVVNSENPTHNRVLSRSGHELRFDDDEQTPNIILQTLGSEHYFELNANTEGKHYIEWLSRLGNISLHAAGKLLLENSEGNIDFQIDGHQHIDAKHSVAIEVKADSTAKDDTISIQSATHLHHAAQKVGLSSEKQTTLLSGRSIKTQANSKILWQSAQGDMAINASQGATIVNAQGNIEINGTGNGDITLFNQGGMIKLDSSGNVELIGKDVLTLNGSMITLDGEVQYDIASPNSASEPNTASPQNIPSLSPLNLTGDTQLNSNSSTLTLSYFDTDGQPIEDIDFEVIDSQGVLHTGKLQAGEANLTLPIGQCEITYLGASQADEQELVQLRLQFKQHLNSMLAEIRQQAAREEALFEQESLFTQWMIQTGAVMTGVYQGGKSLVTGVADIVTLSLDVHIQLYSACFEVLNSLQRGDTLALKQQLETILTFSEKTTNSLTQAFELLVIIIEDDETRNTLAHFPVQYFDAHSFVEKHRIAGIFLFEILLAVLTAGVGTAVSAISKSKHLVNANKRLADIAKVLKRKRLNQSQIHALQGKNEKAITKIEQPKAKLEAPKFKRLPHPVSMKDALNRLTLARQSILKHGYRAKYSDDELLAMAKSGEVAKERFHVRFMEKGYLQDRNTPNIPLSGKLGGPFKGKSGDGVKYWSTTFDQLEDTDSDPKLISEKLGLTYDPKNEYTMIIIDSHKAAETSGAKSLTPTFDELGQFAKEELDTVAPNVVNSIFTPEYQVEYQKHYNNADSLGIDLWEIQGMEDFSELIAGQGISIEHFESRLELHGKLGSNEDFLGTGVTQNNMPSSQQFGVVETFTLERTPQTLSELKENDAISIIDTLTPIGK